MQNLLLFGLLLLVVLASGCTQPQPGPQQYSCPDFTKYGSEWPMMYEEETGTFVMGIDCMPVTTEPLCQGTAAKDYKNWVNENCGVKFRIDIAY